MPLSEQWDKELRKIVQITVAPAPPGGEFIFDIIYALCNDGSVWRIVVDDEVDRHWEKLEKIPQDA